MLLISSIVWRSVLYPPNPQLGSHVFENVLGLYLRRRIERMRCSRRFSIETRGSRLDETGLVFRIGTQVREDAGANQG